jgi:zinc protease
LSVASPDLRRRRSARFWFLGLLLLLGTAFPALALDKPYREILPNGATLLVLPTRSSPTVSVNVFVKVGSFEETAQTNGITHFYEHLFFRGTPNLSGPQFKRAIEAIGGTTNAATTRDFTHFYINLPCMQVDQGMSLLADALINAELSEESVDHERKTILEEYRLNSESPLRVMGARIYEMAYGQHPYGKPIIGTEENISSFQRQDFLRFRDSFYAPERTSVVIVGDVDLQEVIPRARELFGSFHREAAVPELLPDPVPPPEKEVRVVETSAPTRTSFVILGYPGPSVKDRPDIYQVDVLSFMLGIGRGSLLGRELVETQKAMEAGVDFLTQRHPGLIIVSGVAPAGQEEALREDLLAVIEKVREGDFSDQDLLRARNFLRSTYLLGNETNSGKADSLGFYAAIDEVDFATTYVQEIEKVTRQDVIQAARKYLGPGRYCLIVKARRPAGEEKRSRAR